MEEGYGEWPSFLGLPSHLQRSRELRGKRCENTGWTSDGVKLPSKMKVRKLFDKGLNAVDYYTKELVHGSTYTSFYIRRQKKQFVVHKRCVMGD